MKPPAAKIESTKEGSGTSGVSGIPIPNQVMARKRGQRMNATDRMLQQYEKQALFLVAGHECCETIGWSVVKTFMGVMPPNENAQRCAAKDPGL